MDAASIFRNSDRFLIIDEDPWVHGAVEGIVQRWGGELRAAAAGAAGIEQLRQWRPDVVLLNDRLPDQPGIEVLPQIVEIDPHVPVLFTVDEGAAENAIEATRRGAFDCFFKPLSLDQLRQSFEQARENRRLRRAPVVIESSATAQPQDRLIGRCEAMQRVYKSIGRIASHDQPALIVGPTGVGKRLVARAIHAHGRRSSGPFISVRCGDHRDGDLGSVLFTASADQPSAIQQAEGGVLLLEEFETVAMPVQARVRDLIAKRSSMPAGAGARSSGPAGAVLLLSLAVEEDRLPPTLRKAGAPAATEPPVLRDDLYYELAGNVIMLPPLRQRGDDLRLLVEHYAQRLSGAVPVSTVAPARISADALELLRAYEWPGNITELKSVLRRAMMESPGAIVASDHLRQALQPRSAGSVERSECTREHAMAKASPQSPTRLADVDWTGFVEWQSRAETFESTGLYVAAVEELERGLITATLRRTGGNLAQAARMLGMTRVSLRKKILKLDVEIPGRSR